MRRLKEEWLEEILIWRTFGWIFNWIQYIIFLFIFYIQNNITKRRREKSCMQNTCFTKGERSRILKAFCIWKEGHKTFEFFSFIQRHLVDIKRRSLVDMTLYSHLKLRSLYRRISLWSVVFRLKFFCQNSKKLIISLQ